jgi:amino acid adenylation domain-containing protein
MMQRHAESVQQLCLLDFFQEQANKRPDAVCLEFRGRQWTYARVDSLSSRVADRLRQSGARPGVLIAIYLERSLELVAAILGVLKSGAAYLPVDPMVPEKRLEFMLQDSDTALVITQQSLKAKLGRARCCLIEDLLNSRSPGPLLNYSDEAAGDDLAYVIYTSGSTGRPKGVEILHRSFALSVEAIRQELGLTEKDTVLAVTSQSFDVSGLEIFLGLISGARVVLLPPNHAMQSDLLRTAVEDCGATILFGTPALWRLLLESGWSGSGKLQAIVGGENLDPGLAKQLLDKTAALWNHYGPTETTIVATTCRVKPEQSPIPIGRSLPHVRLYVVDDHGELAEQGHPGELYIGGDCLARGYRNHPELTESRFIVLTTDRDAGERVYRTGDLVRWLPDGQLEFLHRLDNQVKLRGFRIELEEIEALLSDHPALSESAVVVHEDDRHEKALVAYYRANGTTALEPDHLRSFLSSRLPPYMVPSHFLKVERLPTSVNGKVDRLELSRRELTLPDSPASSTGSANPIERELLGIWRKLLKRSSIEPTDNFFEIGGHSILAARMFAEIDERFKKVLPLSALFEAPTIELLAKIIAGEAAQVGWSPLVPIRKNGTGTPFFCVHPIGGNVLIFQGLSAHMGLRRPFYALQARGLNGQEAPHTSIEAMAADYLSFVTEIQPSGPYFLGGYSAGGLVAFEMARLLQDRGESVELLVLFDSYLHPHSLSSVIAPHQRSAWMRGTEGLARRMSQMRVLDQDRRRLVVGRDVARMWSTIKLNMYSAAKQLHLPAFRLDSVSAFLLALRNYSPRPLGANVLLFLATKPAPEVAKGLELIWKKLITGTLDIRHIETDHDELLDESHARLLAAQIEDRFDN